MRIFFFSQYFAPEVTAARARVEPFAHELARQGHEVVVLCEVPNHPEGIVHEGYRHRPLIRRKLGDVEVVYLWVRATPKKTPTTRMLFYGSYAAMATIVGSALKRPDMVIASSPPLPVAAAAAAVARRHRVPWIFDVRDLWPEAAVILGELTNPRIISWAERLEQRLYADAGAIVTVTEPFRAEMEAKGVDPGKIEVIPNGTTQAFLEGGEIEVSRDSLGLAADEFLWTYAGNVGIAQDLETALEAAELLGPGFRLLILGAGPRLEALRERAGALPTAAVEFRGLVQPDVAIRYMRASDALLVPLKDQAGLTKFVPSKLFDCCAVGRPVVVAASGEASRLAAEASAALTVAPGDAEALATAIRSLRDEPQLGEGLAVAGRQFAARHLRERQAERLDALINSLRGYR